MGFARFPPVLGVVVVAALLSGCVPSADPERPPPLTEEGRLGAYEKLLDLQWEWVEGQYPDAIRPDVPDPVQIDQASFSTTLGPCLESIGYSVQEDGGYSGPSPDADPREVAVGDYYCYGAFPSKGTLEALLSDEELDALYTFYVEMVIPCLAVTGQKVTGFPDRRTFVEASRGAGVLHPLYFLNADRSITGEDLLTANGRCTLEPAWYGGITSDFR